jgi:hypothetical protein
VTPQIFDDGVLSMSGEDSSDSSDLGTISPRAVCPFGFSDECDTVDGRVLKEQLQAQQEEIQRLQRLLLEVSTSTVLSYVELLLTLYFKREIPYEKMISRRS